MTDKEEILAILQTVEAEHNVAPKLLFKLREDIQESKYFKLEVYDRRLHDLILHLSKDAVIKISTVNLLYLCVSKGLFNDISHLDLLNCVLDVLISDVQNVEEQPRWLKALDVVLHLEKILMEVLVEKQSEIIKIFHVCLQRKATSYQQKKKALDVLSYLFENSNEKLVTVFVGDIFEQLLMLMFSSANPSVQNKAIDLGYQILPHMSKTLHIHWDKIVAVFKDTYISPMNNFVMDANCVFSKLWIFLTKLFGSRLHRTALMMNPMLAIVETAFKSQNFSIRMEAFLCWQALIENYALDSKELLSPKRIKLLIIPLKTNNCKTAELIVVKFQTWCKFINYIASKIEEYAKGLLDAFLNFCFGQLSDTPLASINAPTLLAPGKKYSGIFLSTSKALLQLIGQPKYIDEELSKSLDLFSFSPPLITKKIFAEMSKLCIFATGESSLLLSEVEETGEAHKINIALWKSLFSIVDTSDSDNKKRSVEDVACIILAILAQTAKRTALFNFTMKPIIGIILTKEFSFFQEKHLHDLLYLPMLTLPLNNEWESYTECYSVLCDSYCLYKRTESNDLHMIQPFISMRFVNDKKDHTKVKLTLLLKLWLALRKELIFELDKMKMEKLHNETQTNTLLEFLKWPLFHFLGDNVHENIQFLQDIKGPWKELYHTFNSHTTDRLRVQVQISLLSFISSILEKNTQSLEFVSIFSGIVKTLRSHKCVTGNCDELRNILTSIRDVILIPAVSKKAIHEIFMCVAHLLTVCSNSQCEKVTPQAVDCIEAIITYYGSTDILKHVEELIKNLASMHDRNPALEKLYQIMKKMNDPAASDQIKGIFNLLVEKLKVSDKDAVSNAEGQSPPQTKYEKDMEKQHMSLLGYDPVTMTPVKLRGSLLKNTVPGQSCSVPVASLPVKDTAGDEYVVIDTPYKFDPKKLPKSQREKLSRRRDDIPALYQDLSQSQTNTIDSNSFPTEDSAGALAVASQEVKKPNSPEPALNNDVSNHQVGETTELTLGKENERKRKKLTSLEKELLRIQIDTKDGGEYKNRVTKRRTRSCYGNHSSNTLDQADTKVLRSKNSSEPSQPKIAKTGNVNVEDKDKPQTNEVPECRVLATPYPFEEMKPGKQINVTDSKTGKVGVVKGPKKISPFKIIRPSYTPAQINTELCKKIDFAADEGTTGDTKATACIELKIDEPPHTTNEAVIEQPESEGSLNTSDTMETLSISSEIVVEINQDLMTDATTITINENVCREVLLDASLEVTSSKLIDRPASPLNRNSIVTSPVQCDTPTRNTELMKSTCEISPIKVRNNTNEAEQPTTSNIALSENDENSPDLFSQVTINSDSANVSLEADEQIIKPKEPVPEPISNNITIKKNYLGGRSAQMMNMVSAQSTLLNTEPRQTKPTRRRLEKPTFSSPTQNRTKKMMEKLANNDNKEAEREVDATSAEINEEDFLTFTKPLPLPSALPGPSILKKRKCPDTDDTLQPCSKKRKVNFSDPLVAAEKYIEKNVTITVTEKGSRILRSAKNVTSQIEMLQTTDTVEKHTISETSVKNAKESRTESDEGDEVTSSNECATVGENEHPACPELVNSTDSVKSMVGDLSGFEFIEPWVSVLSARGINTVGQLAQLTDTQKLKIPLKMSQLRAAFKTFLQRNSRNSNRKVKKIKPITLSTKVESSENKTQSSKTTVGFSKRLKVSFNHTSRKQNLLGSSTIDNKFSIEELPVSAVTEMTSDSCEHDQEIVTNGVETEVSHVSDGVTNVMDCTIFGIKVNNFMKELVKMNHDVTPIITALVGNYNLSVVLRALPIKAVISFIAKTCNLVDVLNECELEAIYKFLCDFDASTKKCLNLTFLEVIEKLYSVIMENPRKVLVMDNLATVHISHVIVNRTDSKMSTENFVKRLYGDLYAQRVINKNLALEENSKEENRAKTLRESLLAACSQLSQVDKDVLVKLHRCISDLFSVEQLHDLHYQEMRKKLKN